MWVFLSLPQELWHNSLVLSGMICLNLNSEVEIEELVSAELNFGIHA
jgi:hypothetical protein